MTGSIRCGWKSKFTSHGIREDLAWITGEQRVVWWELRDAEYREIDPTFGTWADIGRLAQRHDVVLDLMVNHVSRRSREFADFVRHGRG